MAGDKELLKGSKHLCSVFTDVLLGYTGGTPGRWMT